MRKIQLILVLIFAAWQINFAGNPILSLGEPGFLYAADPSAEVFNGKVYVYCSHDQDNAVDYSSMQDYVVLESEDMVNWTNHGVVLKPREYTWASGQMNAPDAAYKDGWYYFYFPYDKTYIGVAKSRTPVGPWEEAVTDKITTIFDPTVIVDDDGQAYIYGSDSKVDIGDPGKHIMGAKLKDNMIELDGPWIRLSEEEVNEAVHVFKRNGIYYFNARVGSVTKYWMANTPLPQYATLKGQLAPDSPISPNHASAIEFNGQWYFFYHRGDVNNGSSVRRSASYEKMYFNADGTIQPIVYTLDSSKIVIPVFDNILYFNKVDSLWPADNSGVRVESAGNIGYTFNNNYVVFDSVNFDAAGKYLFSIKGSHKTTVGKLTGYLLIYINNVLNDSIAIKGTGSWSNYVDFSDTITISKAQSNTSVKFKMHVVSSESYLGNLISVQYNMIAGTEISPNGLTESKLISPELYPNPVKDFFIVDHCQGAKLELYNSLGTLVLEKNNLLNKENINVSGIPNGVYFAKLITEDAIKSQKLIKN